MVLFNVPRSDKKYYPLDEQSNLKSHSKLLSFHTISFTLLLVMSIVTLALCGSLVSKFRHWNPNGAEDSSPPRLLPSKFANYVSKN